MVFSGVYLFQQSTHPGFIGPYYNEQVLTEKAHFCVCINDFYMGEVLSISAYFILAFHNENTIIAHHAMGFPSTFFIKFKHRCVPFTATIFWCLVSVRVMVTECIMCSRPCFGRIAIPEESLHIRRIKYDAIKRVILVWQITAVNSIRDIRWVKVIVIGINLPPENTFSESRVSNFGSLWDMKLQNIWKYICIISDIGRNDQISCGDPVRAFSTGWSHIFQPIQEL